VPPSSGVAVVGCGQWGMNHVRVWYGLGCLRAVCDVDPSRLAAVRETYPAVQAFRHFEHVLRDSDTFGVVLATPARTHAHMAAKSMEAGKDVLIEKPLALTVEDGQRLLDMAQERGLVIGVGHVLLYHPAVQKLAELIEDGALGRVRYLSANRLNFGRIRTEESALWSFAPHDIAIMLSLLGGTPLEVACQGGAYLTPDVSDVTLTSLLFPGGVRGHIFVSWLHPFKEHRFVVIGDRQMAVFDDTVGWEEKLILHPHQVDWVGGSLPVARRAEAVRVPLDQSEPLRRECEDFLRSVETRAQPLATGTSALAVLRVLEAGQQSLERGGRPQPLDAPHPASLIDPTATVDHGARVGEGTRVWHYTHIMTDASIGRHCVLGQNVFVGRGVRIGDGTRVQNNVSLYEGVELEDHVFCGPSSVFTNVLSPRSERQQKSSFLKTLVKRGATLGANCTIICGVTIGRYAFVAAGSVVTQDVPDYCLVMGVPGREAGWVCECGTRLAFVAGRAACPCGLEYVRGSAGAIEARSATIAGAGR
jgi:UDP-2-acetamido-3-amino-2,3-dideoxy-glucuronate N-acetyltransferase